jgi:hypothetical protein
MIRLEASHFGLTEVYIDYISISTLGLQNSTLGIVAWPQTVFARSKSNMSYIFFRSKAQPTSIHNQNIKFLLVRWSSPSVLALKA